MAMRRSSADAFVNAVLDCKIPHPAPLVSLIILTCNRHKFLQLALAAAEMQTYPNLEAVVVDDGKRMVPDSLLQSRTNRVAVRIVRLTRRASIGQKRNAGFRAARGAVVLHWDDDDIHSPLQASTLACPILRNMTELSSLTFSHLASLSSAGISFHSWGKGRGAGATTGAFLGTLAYSRAVASSLTLHSTVQRPFPDSSLSEDLHFVERALDACHRFLPIRGVPIIYTRHASVSNTWRPTGLDGRMAKPPIEPPRFVTRSMRDAYVAAEREALEHGACTALRRHQPKGLIQPSRSPFMPARCCEGRKVQMKKPCQDVANDCGDSFCGATKGTCTATCTCPGEAAHRNHDGAGARRPCGGYCCSYWHAFWRANPQNCSMKSARPLKKHYCGGQRRGAVSVTHSLL